MKSGRSMGSATSLMYCGGLEYKDSENVQKVGALVLDSGFSDFNKVVDHITSAIPRFLVSFILFFLKKQVEKEVGMVLDEMKPSEYAKRVPKDIPVKFVHGDEDDFIAPVHSEQLEAAYAGSDKELIMVEGDHNSERDSDVTESLVEFLTNKLCN
jgi:fermentation-respiration switch protein FrsA (DUF1100 family)